MKHLYSYLRKQLLPPTVTYQDTILPARHFRLGGNNFKRDEDFFNSGQREARRLTQFCHMTSTSAVLEIGCGYGRLPIGILSSRQAIKTYTGIDVNSRAIGWCQKYISKKHPSFTFVRVDAKNARYNPNGRNVDDIFKLPCNDASADVIYLYSVFSHMLTEDVQVYLREFKRILKPSGTIFLTAFIEESVEPISVNPPNYHQEWHTELHCVRYEKNFFEKLLAEQNFAIQKFDYATETDGQSGVYIARTSR